MYGFWAVPVLGNFHFNVIKGNGSLYGTHPFHWYITSGIPAIVGALLPLVIYDGIETMKATRNDRRKLNLWIIAACFIIAHSLSEHKEFRFLLPILPIFCLLCGSVFEIIVSRSGPICNCTLVIVLFASVNIIPILYLGLFHQRAPIDVNRAILESVSARQRNTQKHQHHRKPTKTVTVHYLMGCHSTPLLSHLHNPTYLFQPWYLDCSPSCRADPDVSCESERFLNDPETFVKEVYGIECVNGDVEMTCALSSKDVSYTNNRSIPDFVVANSNDILKIKSQLDLMKMKEIGRFANGINGIKVGDYLSIGENSFTSNASKRIGLFHNTIIASLEEIILFQNSAL